MRKAGRTALWRTLWRTLWRALPLAVAALWYGYTLRLPFFLDDGPNFWTLDHLDGLDQWDGTILFPYYRPLVFSLWKGVAALVGYDPVIFHLLNVLGFGLAGVVMGQVVRRLWWRLDAGPGRELAGAIAGIGFVVFPFSYQAVTLVSGLFHLAFALGLTLCLWLALVYLDGRGGRVMLVLCWLAAFFAVFSHENAPLIAPLLVGVIALAYWGRWPSPRRLALVVVPVTALAGLYTLLWFTVPRTTSREGLMLTNQFDLAQATMLQGLVYPVVAVARALTGAGSAEPGPVLALVTLAVIPAWSVAWRRSRSLGLLAAYGLGWYALSTLPSALMLSPDYILGSPRLMLVASLGGGLFWGAALGGLWPRRTGRAIALGVLALALVVSGTFWRARRTDFLRAGDYTWRLVDLVEAQAAHTDRLLLANALNYTAPDPPMFLLGSEGVTFMMDFLGYEQQVWLNTGLDIAPDAGRIETLAYDQALRYAGGGYTPHGDFLGGPALHERLRAAPLIIATRFEGRAYWPTVVGGADWPGPGVPLATDPQSGLRLLAAEAAYSPARDTVTVLTRWALAEPQPVKLFAHVWCGDRFLAQSDGYPWGDMLPFSAWEPGEVQADVRTIRLPPGTDPACLRVMTGVYWEADVTRLPLVDAASGDPFPDGAVPVPLRVSDALVPFAPRGDAW